MIAAQKLTLTLILAVTQLTLTVNPNSHPPPVGEYVTRHLPPPEYSPLYIGPRNHHRGHLSPGQVRSRVIGLLFTVLVGVIRMRVMVRTYGYSYG